MSNYLKASVISILLLFNVLSNLWSQTKEKSPLGRQFKNCDEAFEAAKEHVTNYSILFFMEKVRFEWHTKHEALTESINLSIKRADQFDSVMLAMYKIKVLRPGDINLYDYTQNCYNKFILNHMDTVYAEFFVIEAYNIVSKLNGEPPFDPTWVKKLKVTTKD